MSERKKLSLSDFAGHNLGDDAKSVLRAALKDAEKAQNKILREAKRLERMERRKVAQ